jgi:hypothetical protein
MVGRSGVYVSFGLGMGCMFNMWMDAHGAGCQRSDPKDGELSEFTYLPYGYYFGDAPQGDAIRLFNYVRCVRDSGETGVVEPESTSSLRWSPNPFSGSTAVSFALPAGCGGAECVIYDVGGRAVRTLAPSHEAASLIGFAWDGTSDSGAPVSSGVYFAVLESNCDRARMRLVKLR